MRYRKLRIAWLIGCVVAVASGLILYTVKVLLKHPSFPQMTETTASDGAIASENSASGQIDSFNWGLTDYYTDVKEYPHTLKPLSASAITGWHGPYRRGFAKDPWDHEWMYLVPGKHNPDSFDIWSVGPDGVDGTADDIGNWRN